MQKYLKGLNEGREVERNTTSQLRVRTVALFQTSYWPEEKKERDIQF